jgi:hypothetical protein
MDADRTGGVVRRRLGALHLTGRPFRTPEDVVGGLVAIQAQDYGPAKWAIGSRTAGATDEGIERLLSEGAILRTHVLRPTWHFVLPADIRWLLTATAPRIRLRDAPRFRQLGLDADTLARSAALLAGALRGGNLLTRAEVAALLERGGVDAAGQRLPYILMNAELDGLICSGPRRGAQHAYALLEQRAPDARDLPRDEALAELARRYFGSHGPATEKDFATWASLTLAEVRAALDAAGPEVRREVIGGLGFWAAAGQGAGPRLRSPSVRLLQGYDEYIMGYSESRHVVAPPGSGWSPAAPPVFRLVILLDGRLAGFWRRTVKPDGVVVEAALLEEFTAPQLEALEAEAARYGSFLGLTAALLLAPRAAAGAATA